MAIGAAVLSFFAWWVVLFTGVYPRSFFDYQVNLIRWTTRLQARMMHLSDGYPAFGMNGQDDKTVVHIAYPEKLNQGLLLIRLFFQFFYLYIPHGICLFGRLLLTPFIVFIAWWAVLFTGQYPKGMHSFMVGTLRWSTRVNIYASFLSDKYPPFTGK